jgi:ATP-dependent DNA ligase
MPEGAPIFARLHMRSMANRVHRWVFDLLSLKGSDLRLLPLVERHASLQSLLERFDRVAKQRGLERVVSRCRDWRKVETGAWRTANRERWWLFEQG